jgi:hypothetical protein
MPALTVSEGAGRQFVCQSCWQLESVVSGFVDRDQEPLASYHATWGSASREIQLALSVGPWGVADEPKRRVMVFRFRNSGSGIHMSSTDGRGHHFYPPMLGRPFSRVEAIVEPKRALYWLAAETAIEADQRISDALRRLVDDGQMLSHRDA